MKEVFTMWRNTRMVVLVALTGALYAASIIPLKAIPIIPGFTELRPGVVFPIVFGLLFGPAGAWGAAIGNTIADVYGTLGLGTVFGFLGNFYLAFVMYKMWGAVGLVPADDMAPTLNSPRKAAAFGLVTAVATTVCAVIIAGCLDLAGIVPFKFLALTIVVNNLLAGIVLGPLLLLAIYPFVKRVGLVWTDLMKREDVAAGTGRHAGAVLMAVGGLGGLASGMGAGTELFRKYVLRGEDTGSPTGLWAALAPFLLLILIGGFLLSGREQFPKEEAAGAAASP